MTDRLYIINDKDTYELIKALGVCDNVVLRPPNINRLLEEHKNKDEIKNVICVDFYPRHKELEGVFCDIYKVKTPLTFLSICEAIESVKHNPRSVEIIQDYLYDVELYKECTHFIKRSKLILNDIDFVSLFNHKYRNILCFIPELNKWAKFLPTRGWVDANAKEPLNLINCLICDLEQEIERYGSIGDTIDEDLTKARKYLDNIKSSTRIHAMKRMVMDVNAIHLSKFISSRVIKFRDGVLDNGNFRETRTGDLFFDYCVGRSLHVETNQLHDELKETWDAGIKMEEMMRVKQFFHDLLFFDSSKVVVVKGLAKGLNRLNERNFIKSIMAQLYPYAGSFNVLHDNISNRNIADFFNKRFMVLQNYSNRCSISDKAKGNLRALLGLDSLCLQTNKAINLNTNIVVFDGDGGLSAGDLSRWLPIPKDKFVEVNFSFLKMDRAYTPRDALAFFLSDNYVAA